VITEWDDRFTPEQRRAIALTLLDLDGWGTIHGKAVHFDTQTGERLPEPVLLMGDYDRRVRSGLPEGWKELFRDLGWLGLVELANGWVAWKPTRVGAAVRDAWLPEHLRGGAS
jgi:hypothetical protein